MSQPNNLWRFDCVTRKDGDALVRNDRSGQYCLYSDYAALVQQGIRDHQDWRSKLNFLEADYKAEIARLTAENERLRKAGDAVCESPYLLETDEAVIAWRAAAKEGRDAK